MNIEQLVKDVDEGVENPLKAYAIIRSRQKQLADAIAHIEEYAMDEAVKYGERSFTDMGWRFDLRDGSRRCSFKEIDEWVRLNKAIKEKEAQYKEAAVAHEKGNSVVDENGEVVPPAAVSYTRPSISVRPA